MANNSQESNDPAVPAGALGEISQGPGAFETFLDQHHKKVLILGLLAAIGVAAYVVNDGIRDGRETAGGNALHQAGDIASLQGVLKNHGESRAAGSAAILLAGKQWDEGQQDAAIETLRTFIESPDEHPAKPSARASLGSKLAAQGKSGDAADVFRTLADDRTDGAHLAPLALINLGDLAQAAGETAEAEAHYTRVQTEFSTSPFSDAAARRLQFLNAEMPVAVEPPAPEPEPETTPETAPETAPEPQPEPEPESSGETPVEPETPDTAEEAEATSNDAKAEGEVDADPTSE